LNIDLSIVLALKNAEDLAPAMVRTAVAIAQTVEPADGVAGDLAFEVLALDQNSSDNTLAVLSVLHVQIAQLRTIQGLEPGTAIMRGARMARGHTWLLLDRPADFELSTWAVRQVLCGHRAALIPGELLAVERGLGQATLGWMRGGLVRAQREVRRSLSSRGEKPAFSPPPDRGLVARARLALRSGMSRFGVTAAALDRPERGVGRGDAD